MLIRLRKLRSQRGDTIVEVLISVAIVSLVLAGAYAITNRNVAVSQDTQERSQALQLAQQQLEMMRALSSAVPAVAIPVAPPAIVGRNCIKVAAGIPSVAGSASDCHVSASGAAGCVSDPCYDLRITPGPSAAIYEVSVTWTNLHQTTSTVSLDYAL